MKPKRRTYNRTYQRSRRAKLKQARVKSYTREIPQEWFSLMDLRLKALKRLNQQGEK